ncbi:MAG: hypothetical protein VKK59_04575 [Vampirovibrionales bacterium]|nr:hypothetical protein [Vampirovibrionales bacterium]
MTSIPQPASRNALPESRNAFLEELSRRTPPKPGARRDTTRGGTFELEGSIKGSVDANPYEYESMDHPRISVPQTPEQRKIIFKVLGLIKQITEGALPKDSKVTVEIHDGIRDSGGHSYNVWNSPWVRVIHTNPDGKKTVLGRMNTFQIYDIINPFKKGSQGGKTDHGEGECEGEGEGIIRAVSKLAVRPQKVAPKEAPRVHRTALEKLFAPEPSVATSPANIPSSAGTNSYEDLEFLSYLDSCSRR